MKAVFKYSVPLGIQEPIRMPRGAQLLTVQLQRDVPCVWALVDTNEPNVDRDLRWVGTGHDMAETHQHHYVGTIQVGPYVFHLFEFVA